MRRACHGFRGYPSWGVESRAALSQKFYELSHGNLYKRPYDDDCSGIEVPKQPSTRVEQGLSVPE